MSRETKIKEIAVVLTDGSCKECNCDDNGRFDCLAFYEAERLYNAGYRKPSESAPRDLCEFNPPSSDDGKPCSMRQAQAKMKGV